MLLATPPFMILIIPTTVLDPTKKQLLAAGTVQLRSLKAERKPQAIEGCTFEICPQKHKLLVTALTTPAKAATHRGCMHARMMRAASSQPRPLGRASSGSCSAGGPGQAAPGGYCRARVCYHTTS